MLLPGLAALLLHLCSTPHPCKSQASFLRSCKLRRLVGFFFLLANIQ